jgi:hypothetical protein
MTLITKSSFIPQQNASSSPIGGMLPDAHWYQIVDYLSDEDRATCSGISRRLSYLVLRNVSSDLVMQFCQSTKNFGPTHRFLFSSFEDNCEKQQEIQKVFKKMNESSYIAKTVLDICKVEAMLPEYVPLYHGINIATYILSYFTYEMHSLLHPNKSLYNIPIRFPNSEGPRTIDKHFKKFPITKANYLKYDWDPDVRRVLLSCTPQLFTNFQFTGIMESPWLFYCEGINMNPPSKYDYFDMLCKEYELNFIPKQKNVFLNRFLYLYNNLFDMKNRDYGMVLQIFIPPALIDKVAYASLRLGIPCSPPTRLSQRCAEIRKKPCFNDEEQVRFLTQRLFEDNGIKMFVHGEGFFSDPEGSLPYLYVKKQTLHEIRKLFMQMLLADNNAK